MCPACMTSIAPMAAGGTSAGGLAVLGLTRFNEQGLAELKALAGVYGLKVLIDV